MSNTIDYWFWKNFLNKNKIKDINSFIDKNFDFFEQKEKTAHDLNGNTKKNNIVKVIQYKKIKDKIIDEIDEFMYCGKFNFGYDLYKISPISKLNLNIYSSTNKDNYDWHTDSAHNDLYDIKLTALINLSINKYEGGSFKIWNTNETEIKEFSEPGDMILFKSNINHKVTPVVKGERRTLAIFLNGPKFK